MSKEVSQMGEDGVFVFDNISSLDRFSTFLNHDWVREADGYVWRGQRRASWRLSPTLDRVLAIGDPQSYANAAEVLLSRFKLSARGRIPTVDVPSTEDDWWALAQHHGLPTPLLDWTLSPYVGAFFAFAEAEKDDEEHRAIFMIHYPTILQKAQELGDRETRFFTPQIGSNHRLINQSGLFSQFPCATDIENWVRENFAGSEQIILGKLILPNAIRNALLQSLNSMNVNYNTLFPDLDGAARHVSLSLGVPGYLPRRRPGEVADF